MPGNTKKFQYIWGQVLRQNWRKRTVWTFKGDFVPYTTLVTSVTGRRWWMHFLWVTSLALITAMEMFHDTPTTRMTGDSTGTICSMAAWHHHQWRWRLSSAQSFLHGWSANFLLVSQIHVLWQFKSLQIYYVTVLETGNQKYILLSYNQVIG